MKERFGKWEFDKERLTLTHLGENYEIDLETMTNSAKILVWIFQIQAKVWATPQVVYDLIEAIRALIHPQGNVCSFGIDNEVNVAELVKKGAHPGRPITFEMVE